MEAQTYSLPLVSVILPNFNHRKYLKQRLDCVFNQTYTNFEVILLDDLSTDNSREILVQYAEKENVSHCVFNETNSGNTFRQWAKGIKLAKGDLIWIAETDDFCDTNFLETLIKPFHNNPEVAMVYCQSNRVNEFGEVTGNWITHTDNLNKSLFLKDFIMDGNQFIQDFLIYKNVIPNASGVIFRKKNAVEIGELDFDPVLKTCGDWLFYVKLLANSEIAFINQSLNNFRYHSGSVISRAKEVYDKIAIIDIELKTRTKIIDFLKNNKIQNDSVSILKNAQIVKELKYEKASLLFSNNRKISALLIWFFMPIFIFKKKKIIKRIKLRIKNF